MPHPLIAAGYIDAVNLERELIKALFEKACHGRISGCCVINDRHFATGLTFALRVVNVIISSSVSGLLLEDT